MATLPVLKTPNQRTFVTATVTTAATGLSDVIDCGGLALTALQMSAAWTDATLGFLGSFDSSANLLPMYTSTGGELAFGTTAARTYTFDPYLFAGVRFVQLRSGSSASPVAQAAARSVVLSLAPYAPIK